MRDLVGELQSPRVTDRVLPPPNLGISYREGDAVRLDLVYWDTLCSIELRLTRGDATSFLQIVPNSGFFEIRVVCDSVKTLTASAQPLRFLVYGIQIQSFLELFMSFDRQYWDKRNPLPDISHW